MEWVREIGCRNSLHFWLKNEPENQKNEPEIWQKEPEKMRNEPETTEERTQESAFALTSHGGQVRGRVSARWRPLGGKSTSKRQEWRGAYIWVLRNEANAFCGYHHVDDGECQRVTKRGRAKNRLASFGFVRPTNGFVWGYWGAGNAVGGLK